MMQRTPLALAALAAAVIAWECAHAQVREGSARGTQLSLAPMVARVTPGVVGISVAQRERDNPLLNDPYYRRFFEEQRGRRAAPEHELRASGSGVIIDARQGLVLTNHHVIQSASKVVVVLKDRREFDAVIVGSDAGTDVALLRIAADNLTAVSMGNSDAMSVGDFVVAIGNPFGIGQTVTSGIVSALGRGLSPEGYEDYIQTDAAINPGNSGGALVNLDGELIGINTAIIGAGARGQPAGNIGIGFAVPSNMARAVIAQLQKYGEVRRGRIGIGAKDVTPRLARERNLGVTEGAFVETVEKDSPAERGGVRAGDVVVALNKRPVHANADLRNQVALIPVGDTIDIAYWRGGATHATRIAVAPIVSTATQAAAASAPPLAAGRPASGLLAGASFGETARGVIATKVERDSRAYQLGVREGDLLDAVDRQRVAAIADLGRLLGASGRHIVNIIRGETKLQIAVQ
jgi:Do/DeqQ family serine protease